MTYIFFNDKISGKSCKGGKSMKQDKYIWTAKVGDKGQIVIPKEAREIFKLNPGDEIIVLGDIERGIAILPKSKQQEYIKHIFCEIEE